MRLRSVITAALCAVLGAVLAVPLAAVPARAGTAVTAAWAPAASAQVHPGVMTFTSGGQCTANFVFTNGATTYIGQAAHCASTGGPTDTNGCQTGSLPLGTPVDVNGFTGTLAYSSWLAMQSAHESDASTCAFNDLALVQLPAAAVATTNPSVPFWGGPSGLGGGTLPGDQVYTYGNSELRLGLSPLSPKTGISLGDTGDGWSTQAYTVTPGIPGDSGSGFMDASGRAIGVLSTIEALPLPASNNFGNLAKEVAYAQAHGLSGLALVPGTEPFAGI